MHACTHVTPGAIGCSAASTATRHTSKGWCAASPAAASATSASGGDVCLPARPPGVPTHGRLASWFSLLSSPPYFVHCVAVWVRLSVCHSCPYVCCLSIPRRFFASRALACCTTKKTKMESMIALPTPHWERFGGRERAPQLAMRMRRKTSEEVVSKSAGDLQRRSFRDQSSINAWVLPCF